MQLNYGNLLEMAKNGEFDVIIHGANSFHTMGAGIAKYIKQDFPEAYEADKKTGYGDKNKIGTFSEATIERNGNTFVIINAYTQFKYGGGVDNFEYDTFPNLLQSIKEKYGDKRIGLPLIGCGLAGGDEPRILKMIRENFDGVNYKLVEIDKNRKLNLGEEKEEVKEISFTKVSLPFGWLGNMAPYPVEYQGKKYLTTEALFQSLRFKNYPEVQEKIMQEKSPMGAKMVAKANKNLLEKDGYEFLGREDFNNMKLCISLKLEQHPELKEQLLETKNLKIVEDCSSRPQGSGLFWGAEKTRDGWNGKNVLGEIWMEQRKKILNMTTTKAALDAAYEHARTNGTESTDYFLDKVASELGLNNEEVEYTYFFHLTSPFSNFHPSKFEYKDLTFISNEQFMMYSKAKNFGDEVIAERILKIYNEFMIEPGVFKDQLQKNCFQLSSQFQQGNINREQILSKKENIEAWNEIHKKIKGLGREVKNYNDDFWSKKRKSVVKFGARLKFSQNEDLKNILLNTGNTIMVEASKYDKLSPMYLVIQKLIEEFKAENKAQSKIKP